MIASSALARRRDDTALSNRGLTIIKRGDQSGGHDHANSSNMSLFGKLHVESGDCPCHRVQR